jgi:hypothetical protein
LLLLLLLWRSLQLWLRELLLEDIRLLLHRLLLHWRLLHWRLLLLWNRARQCITRLSL